MALKISNAYHPSAVNSQWKKLKRFGSEQGELIVGIGASIVSLFAAVAICVLREVVASTEEFITPQLAYIICIPFGVCGVIVSFWALILRPNWLPVFGILLGIFAIAAGLGLGFLLGMSELGGHPL